MRSFARGGTTVVVCTADAVRGVLAHVLGVPDDRRARLAVAAGSLAGLEVWDDGAVSVAFTNRTRDAPAPGSAGRLRSVP